MKAARIGFSFATALKAVIDCLKRPNETWTVLSASKAQSVEFIDTVRKIVQLLGAVANYIDNETFSDLEGTSSFTQSRVEFGNGSRIIALPANPRTARGYPGNAILDEFAHHQDSYAIWAAVLRQVARGHKVCVLSTPAGEQGKFFDLAKQLGLVDGMPAEGSIVRRDVWSGHWVDVRQAVEEGCDINIEEMRSGMADEEIFAQEFLCVFLKSTGAWLPLDLIAMCEDAGATVDFPAGYKPSGPLYAGIDVARDHDKTVLWLDEIIGDVAWTRMVLPLRAMSFPKQHDLLAPWVSMTRRTAVDCTGMGVGIFDYLAKACPGRVMGINFAGSNDQGVKMKTDLAIRIKKQMEKAKSRIPHDLDIRQALMSVKRESTASGVKFDAPRIEVASPVPGSKKKSYGHADEFWAKALADYAAAMGQQIHNEVVVSNRISAHSASAGCL